MNRAKLPVTIASPAWFVPRKAGVHGGGEPPEGRFDPSLPLAFQIAAVFELSIEDIFMPDGTSPPSVSMAQ